MKPEVITTITAEELDRWRMLRAKLRAIEASTNGYSKEDIERAFLRQYQMGQEFCERYGIDDTRDWDISAFTGVAFYPED